MLTFLFYLFIIVVLIRFWPITVLVISGIIGSIIAVCALFVAAVWQCADWIKRQ